MPPYTEFVITNPTSPTHDDDSNDDSIDIITMAFIVLFAICFMVCILFATIIICFVVKARRSKTSYSA